MKGGLLGGVGQAIPDVYSRGLGINQYNSAIYAQVLARQRLEEALRMGGAVKKHETVREELQAETDKWLEDIKI